jgi:hypothetical protein
MEDFSARIVQPKPVAYLHHKATKTVIAVYTPINRLQRWFIKWLFGLDYEKIQYGKDDL